MNSETATSSRKRKIETTDHPEPKRQDVEQFPKFGKLANEMRCHILTYCSHKARFNYSQCSKLCSSQIQQFNTITPRILGLTEESDGILVEFSGFEISKTVSNWYKSMGRKKLLFSESENIMDDVVKYLEAFYKYNQKGQPMRIIIDLRKWPKEILKIAQILNTKEWQVTMYKSMFNDFIEFAKSNYGSLDSLILRKGEEVDVIPRDFFKCDAIKNLKKLTTTKCEINDDDFLNLWIPELKITSLISSALIRRKINIFNAMTVCRTRLIRITIPDDDDRIFDLDDLYSRHYLFPNARYQTEDKLCLGRVTASLAGSGKSLNVHRDLEPRQRWRR